MLLYLEARDTLDLLNEFYLSIVIYIPAFLYGGSCTVRGGMVPGSCASYQLVIDAKRAEAQITGGTLVKGHLSG
jgi:hypothetical protein